MTTRLNEDAKVSKLELNSDVIGIFRQILSACKPDDSAVAAYHEAMLIRWGHDKYFGNTERKRVDWTDWWIYWLEMDTWTLWQATRVCDVSWALGYCSGKRPSDPPILNRSPSTETNPAFEMALNALDGDLPARMSADEYVAKPLDYLFWHERKSSLGPLPLPLQLALEIVRAQPSGDPPSPEGIVASVPGKYDTPLLSYEEEVTKECWEVIDSDERWEMEVEGREEIETRNAEKISSEGFARALESESWPLAQAVRLCQGWQPIKYDTLEDGSKVISDRLMAFMQDNVEYQIARTALDQEKLTGRDVGTDFSVRPRNYLVWRATQRDLLPELPHGFEEELISSGLVDLTDLDAPNIKRGKAMKEYHAMNREPMYQAAIACLVAHWEHSLKEGIPVSVKKVLECIEYNRGDLLRDTKAERTVSAESFYQYLLDSIKLKEVVRFPE